MGIQYLSALNMNQNPIYGLVLQSLPNAPENPVEGQIYFDTVDNQPFCYVAHDNENSWVSMTAANNSDVVDGLTTRVEALENILTKADDDESDVTINRLSEVLSFLNGVSDDDTLLSSFLPASKDTADSYTISKGLFFEKDLQGFESGDNFDPSWTISKDGTANFKSVNCLISGSYYPVLTEKSISYVPNTSNGNLIGTLKVNSTDYKFYAPVPDLTGYAKRTIGSIKGDGSTTTFTVTHHLGACVAQVLDSDMHVVYVDTYHRSSTNVEGAYDAVFNFATAPAAGTNYSVILVG